MINCTRRCSYGLIFGHGFDSRRLHQFDRWLNPWSCGSMREASVPPNGYWANAYLFSGEFAIKVLLQYQTKNIVLDLSLRRCFCYTQKSAHWLFQKIFLFRRNGKKTQIYQNAVRMMKQLCCWSPKIRNWSAKYLKIY